MKMNRRSERRQMKKNWACSQFKRVVLKRSQERNNAYACTLLNSKCRESIGERVDTPSVNCFSLSQKTSLRHHVSTRSRQRFSVRPPDHEIDAMVEPGWNNHNNKPFEGSFQIQDDQAALLMATHLAGKCEPEHKKARLFSIFPF